MRGENLKDGEGTYVFSSNPWHKLQAFSREYVTELHMQVLAS